MSGRDAWNPAQYERFAAEREQPFWDLAALVQRRGPELLVDLGCGTGALTARLHQRLDAQRTIGVDSSPAMLEQSAAHASANVSFERADISEWSPPQQVNVLLSNAALQWVDDHERLLPRLLDMLTPGGEIAVQMPANFDHPSHRIAARVAAEPVFADALRGYTRHVPVLSIEQYAAMLHDAGCSEQHVRVQVYGHVLASTADVIEWVRGTLLTDYEKRLPAELYAAFLKRYRELLLADLGDVRPYFYAFKRILLWARRPPA